jgi:hypothetical protein
VILPGKHMKQDRALLAVGGDILKVLREPMSVSVVWDEVRRLRNDRGGASPLAFDWFVLSLTLLFAISAIGCDGDIIVPVERTS